MQTNNKAAPHNQISYYNIHFKSVTLTKPSHSALPTQHQNWILMEVNRKNPRQTNFIHTDHQ